MSRQRAVIQALRISESFGKALDSIEFRKAPFLHHHFSKTRIRVYEKLIQDIVRELRRIFSVTHIQIRFTQKTQNCYIKHNKEMFKHGHIPLVKTIKLTCIDLNSLNAQNHQTFFSLSQQLQEHGAAL